MMKDQIETPPKVHTDEENQERDQKTSIPTHSNLPSETTREKCTKKLKEKIQQRRCGHYTGNKYDLLRETHQYNSGVQTQCGKKLGPTAKYIAVLATNHIVGATTGAYLEYRRLIKGLTKAIWYNSF